MAKVTHPFVSGKTDDADTSLVQASDWNDGHSGYEWYRSAGDHTNSTTTPTDVTGLAFSLAASEVVNFTVYLFGHAAAATTGFRMRATGPASPSLVYLSAVTPSAATTMTPAGTNAFASDVIGTGNSATATAPALTILHGFIVNGTTAGTVQIQVGSEIASSLVTVRRGALLVVWRG